MNRIAQALLVILCATTSAQTSSLKGIELGDLDHKAAPCTDFFEFSNGTWRTQNPIPPSMDRWSRRWKADEDNKDQLRKILDALSTNPDELKGKKHIELPGYQP